MNKKNVVIFYIILISAILSFKGFSANKSSFLILENPFEHRVYNKYEQNLSQKDSSKFLKFYPIEILNTDTLLSDNYTSCYIGKIENETYYFLKPEKGKHISKLYTSYSKYFNNVSDIGDTIQITKENTILSADPKNINEKEFLSKGSVLVRIFKIGARTYVKNLGNSVFFAWCNLSNNSAWEILKKKENTNKNTLAEIQLIVEPKLLEINTILEQLFNQFNQLKSTNIPAPYWTFIENADQIRCTLLNNESEYDFTKSTNLLINELQLLLSHTSFSAAKQSNNIVIQNR